MYKSGDIIWGLSDAQRVDDGGKPAQKALPETLGVPSWRNSHLPAGVRAEASPRFTVIGASGDPDLPPSRRAELAELVDTVMVTVERIDAALAEQKAQAAAPVGALATLPQAKLIAA